ncbi:MAG: class I SAM-dependent methyltransferase [bacterium]
MPPKSFLKKPASLAKGLDRFPRERLHRLSQLEKWHFWFVGRRAWLDSFLQKHFKDKKKRILDLGCGTGFTLKHLAQMGYRAVGTDFRFEGLHRVRRTATSPVVQADATRLPFADLSFDLVVALDVLEHVEDHAALAEIKRILKPQGRLALTVPAFRWLWSVRDDEAGHLRRYTRGEMQTLLRSHGFEKIEIHFRNFSFFHGSS